jgi:hypothetical protein
MFIAHSDLDLMRLTFLTFMHLLKWSRPTHAASRFNPIIGTFPIAFYVGQYLMCLERDYGQRGHG